MRFENYLLLGACDLEFMLSLVSIIIPIYNGKAHLTEAVQSVLKSTYKNFEIILIDDGSTDNSRKLCQLLANRYPQVRTFSFAQNKGLSEALNFAISKAKGVYIARLNQDDLMVADRLEKQVAFLENHRDHVAVGGAIEWFGFTPGNTIISFPITDTEIKKQWLYLSPFSDPASMYRKSVFEKTNGYQKKFWPVDDVHMWYELGIRGKLANLPIVVTKVRWHKNAGSIKSHKTQTKRLFQLHLWAGKHIQKPGLLIWGFWLGQLTAGYIFPARFNWFIYRLIKKSTRNKNPVLPDYFAT